MESTCRFYCGAAALLLSVFICLIGNANAQFQRELTPGDTLTSPKVLEDGRVVFSIYAPNADTVRLGGTDIPGMGGGQGKVMSKRENDVWEITMGPLQPGAYRYNFNADGISVVDPRSPVVSESNQNVWSLVVVPGSEWMDTNQVPHGAIAEVTYYSSSLQKFRRMHVYTPPGYETNDATYPAFYLLHGAFDCDDSWSTVGRAGFILDNLIAANKVKPMVVIMPDGHTRPFRFGGSSLDEAVDEFINDFRKDIVPYTESHYRIKTGFGNRAIAGLSMGGAQTLNLMESFAYVGVFSSGIFDLVQRGDQQPEGPTWVEQNQDLLSNSEYKENLKLLWFATGADDFLIETSRATVDLFKQNDFDVAYKETEGGHTWLNWRDYLIEFAPLLFQD